MFVETGIKVDQRSMNIYIFNMTLYLYRDVGPK